MLGDGTFYSCPGLFTQLYSLHGEVNGVVFPLVFGLLPNQTQQKFLTCVTEAIQERNLVLSPDMILMDFETAAQNTMKSIFPNSDLKRCSLVSMHLAEKSKTGH